MLGGPLWSADQCGADLYGPPAGRKGPPYNAKISPVFVPALFFTTTRS
jgi:hypothetical protein